MNGLDEFLESVGAIFAVIVILMIVLTYLEASLLRPSPPRRRVGGRFRLGRRREAAAEVEPPKPAD